MLLPPFVKTVCWSSTKLIIAISNCLNLLCMGMFRLQETSLECPWCPFMQHDLILHFSQILPQLFFSIFTALATILQIAMITLRLKPYLKTLFHDAIRGWRVKKLSPTLAVLTKYHFGTSHKSITYITVLFFGRHIIPPITSCWMNPSNSLLIKSNINTLSSQLLISKGLELYR